MRLILLVFLFFSQVVSAEVGLRIPNKPVRGVSERGFDFVRYQLVEYVRGVNRGLSSRDVYAIVDSSLKWGEHYGVDVHLVLSVMEKESRFDRLAISSVGAVGLMQFLLQYHVDKVKGLREEVGEDLNLFDIDQNVRIGCQILSYYLKRSKTTEEALRRYGGTLGKSGSVYHEVILSKKAELKRVTRVVK